MPRTLSAFALFFSQYDKFAKSIHVENHLILPQIWKEFLCFIIIFFIFMTIRLESILSILRIDTCSLNFI